MLFRAFLAIFLTVFGFAQPVVAQADGARPTVGGGWGVTVRTGKAAKPKSSIPRAATGAAVGVAAGAAAAAKVASVALAEQSGPVIASNVVLSGDNTRTSLVVDLTAETAFTTFRMANPNRVIVDLDNVEFRLKEGTGGKGRGLIASYRYGLFAAGKARIVIDTTGPIRIDAARIRQVDGQQAVHLELDLIPTTATEMAAAGLANAAQVVAVKPPEPAAADRPAAEKAKPIIVIDPGHGGIDPGAQGAHGYEKDLVLAVSREIRRSLVAAKRYEVVMTRQNDVFVSLDQRVRLSKQLQADLFLSVHADSLAQRELAQAIRGATIYTLADKATDDRARLLAEKENAADVLAGLDVSNGPNDDQVRHILYDLVRRESANFSNDFRSVLVNRLKSKLTLSRDPMRSGPFKVLRQPGSPAVLIELGYMSNAADEKQMAEPAWQRQIGDAVARAVDDYFAKRPQ